MTGTAWTTMGAYGVLESDDDDLTRIVLVAWMHGLAITPDDWGGEDDGDWTPVGAVRRPGYWRWLLVREGEQWGHDDLPHLLG